MGRSRPDDLDDDAGSPLAGVTVVVQSVSRQRGRPKVIDGPGVTLSVWLPTTVYDRLAALAAARRQSISSYSRDVLAIIAGVRPE
jgi:alpha-D-ribose 1-methylphosphonate 5-triphosphate synthase subunit PhnH